MINELKSLYLTLKNKNLIKESNNVLKLIKESSYEQLPLEFEEEPKKDIIYPGLDKDDNELLNDIINGGEEEATPQLKETKNNYKQMMLDFEGKEEVMEDIIKTHFLRLSSGETLDDIDYNEIKKVLSQLESDNSNSGIKSMKDYYFQDFVEDFKKELQRELDLNHDADYDVVAQAIGDLFQGMQEAASGDNAKSFALAREVMNNLFFKAFVVDLDSFDPNKNLISFF